MPLTEFLKDPAKWNPTAVRWWDDKGHVVVVRKSGGVTILSTRDEDQATNILGESAEFFSPGKLNA